MSLPTQETSDRMDVAAPRTPDPLDTVDTKYSRIVTELGELSLLARGDRLSGVYFPGHWPRPPAAAYGRFVPVAQDPVLRQAARELADYLAGRRRTFEVATLAEGEDFQERVWALLAEIPYGTTTTYGAIAEQLGDPALAREVGQAVGRNPLSIVVPCHRVLGRDGRLTGYAGGLARKRRLLELEEAADIGAARLF